MKTYVFSDEHNCDHTYVLAADAQRALDAEREKVKRLSTCGTDHSTPWWQVKCEDLEAQLATLQAQLREWNDACEMMTHTAGTFQELWRGACDQREAMEAQLRQAHDWRDNVTLALQRPGGARFEDVPEHIKGLVRERDALSIWVNALRDSYDDLESRHADMLGDLTTLRQLVEVHTKQLTELTIIPIGCSREQELRWTQSIKDLRAALAAQDAGKEDVSHE